MDLRLSPVILTCWACVFTICSQSGANTETLRNCSRPPYVPGVLQFVQQEGSWVELNETSEEVFPINTRIVFQCMRPGINVLEGIPDIVCGFNGKWSEDAPQCYEVGEILFVEPSDLPRQVNVNGSLTVFLPPVTSNPKVKITCQVLQGREPDFLFPHIMEEEGRAVAMPERGDHSFPKKILTLSPPNGSDSGNFTCQDMKYGNPHRLEINFAVRNVEPTNKCPANLTKKADPGLNSTTVSWLLPRLPQDSEAELTSNFEAGDRFPIGVTIVTYTAQDRHGPVEVCRFFIHVTDEELPRIENCPNDFLVSTNSSQSFAQFKWVEPSALDNSGNPSLLMVSPVEYSNSFPIGSTNVTYEARDASSNVATCSFTVTVRDDEKPTVTCPELQRIVLEPGEDMARIDWPDPVASDNSGNFSIHQSGAERSKLYSPGTYSINYLVSDSSGNSAQCDFQVDVIDEQPPTVVYCPGNQTITFNPRESKSKEVTWADPDFTDNAHDVTMSSSHKSGEKFSPGLYQVVTVAIDSSGNKATCSFTILVEEAICPSVGDMNLSWKQSYPGANISSVQLCPLMTSSAGKPIARRDCLFDPSKGAAWSIEISFENCGEPRYNVTLQEIKEYPTNNETAEDVATTLNNTVSGMELEATDIITVADIIEEVVAVAAPSPKITRSILDTVEMVFFAETEMAAAEDTDGVSKRIIRALDSQVSSLSSSGMELNIATENIAVRTATIENHTFACEKASYEIHTLDDKIFDPQETTTHDDVILPTVKLPVQEITRMLTSDKNTTEAAIHLSFIYYQNPVLFERSEDPDSRDDSLIGNITGGVVSASVVDNDIQNLSNFIEIWFPLDPDENLTGYPAECVFWDFSLTENGGGWSGEGCWLHGRTDEYIICHSNHLTHFAVLMDFTGRGNVSHFVLDLLSRIGCVLSITGLSATIFTFIAFRTLRNSRHRQILINHCVSLLLLYIVFLGGIDSVATDLICKAVAILLHYFLLTTMFWMAVEAHNMYMFLVKIFQRDVRHFILKASIFGWGIPLVIIIASVLTSFKDYQNEEYCFPKPGNLLYVSLLLPIALIMLHNFVIFSMVVCRLVFTDVAGKAITQSRKKQLVSRLQNAMCMSVLMGLSWSLGFIAFAQPSFLIQLLFCIVNSLQGVAVFILFCVRVSDVRTAYKSCMPWLDVELNIRGQSYKVQERSIHQNRGRYCYDEDSIWSGNADKVANALSWPSDTPGLEAYMHAQFERQLSTSTDTTRVSANSFSIQRSNSRFSRNGDARIV